MSAVSGSVMVPSNLFKTTQAGKAASSNFTCICRVRVCLDGNMSHVHISPHLAESCWPACSLIICHSADKSLNGSLHMGQGEGRGRQGPTTVLCLAESTGCCQGEGDFEAPRTACFKHSISRKLFNWSVLLNAILVCSIFSHRGSSVRGREEGTKDRYDGNI